MKIFNSINEFNLEKGDLPKLTIVPTMGNLHLGHISLIDIAKKFNNKIISTIYINKLQFNDVNDFVNYPKTIDKDIELLEKHGCDYLLIPDSSILDEIEYIKAPIKKSQKLCGLNRPGHFDGVLTILNRLFEIIKPDTAIFGKKDYQQFVLVRDFIDDYNLKIKIIGAETVRETNGLALSSRNNLLSDDAKEIAAFLYATLKNIETNKVNLSSDLLNSKINFLTSKGFEVDYLTSCNEESFEESFDITNENLLLAVAAKINNIRLIDNIALTKL